jgi:hypothetical protein
MIQDAANPEYYAVEQKIKHELTSKVTSISTNYRDVIDYPVGFIVKMMKSIQIYYYFF